MTLINHHPFESSQIQKRPLSLSPSPSLCVCERKKEREWMTRYVGNLSKWVESSFLS